MDTERNNLVSKKEVINSLYKIICTTTQSSSDRKIDDNSYFKRRVGGFKAEIEFENELKKNTTYSFLSGGMVLSPEIDGTKDMKNEFTYISIDSLAPSSYEEVYSNIINWNEIKYCYYADRKSVV